MRLGLLAALLLAVGLFWAPAGATVTWPTLAAVQVATGFTQPLFVAHAGDGSGRLFVVERAGRIRILRGSTIDSTAFLDITARVHDSGQEQGLLGLAFPPGYASKGYFYVYYTSTASGNPNVVSRFSISSTDVANAGSETTVLSMADPFSNHNGGMLAFGPNDGYLYIGTGDGGSGGDPGNRAQNVNELLGKLLRIDVEAGASPYAIPPSNPALGGRNEIWAYGLRNPWRFSFDRSTGDLYTGDVGQGSWEEIDFQPAGVGGLNYGWRLREGAHCYNPSTNCNPGGLTEPVVEYANAGSECSVTGGYVYRGPAYPGIQGIYFYGDYCSGKIWGLVRDAGVWTNQQLLDHSATISSFGEDEAGELYFTDLGGGRVYRVTDTTSATATPTTAPTPTAAPNPLLRNRLPVLPRNGPLQ